MLTKDKLENLLGRTKAGKWLRDPHAFLSVLCRAKEKVSPQSNWCQGSYALDAQGRALSTGRTRKAVKFCMLGAVEHESIDFRQYYICKQLLAAGSGMNMEDLARANDSRLVPSIKDGVVKEPVAEDPSIAYNRVLNIFTATIQAMQALI